VYWPMESQGVHSHTVAGHGEARAQHGEDDLVQEAVRNVQVSYDATAEEGGDVAGSVEEVDQEAVAGVGNHDSALRVGAAAVPDAEMGDHSARDDPTDADSSRSVLDSLEAAQTRHQGAYINGDGTAERRALRGCTVEVARRDSGKDSAVTAHRSDVALEAPHSALGEDLLAQSAGSWADMVAPSVYLKVNTRAMPDESHVPSLGQKLQPGETVPSAVVPRHVCH
jgi:hypothetical protein